MCVYDKIMDDFVIANLHESRNEWCGRLVSLFTPLITEGIQSIFDESWRMCVENDEVGKYLMTFQNLISRIPTWNSVIIEEERKRIIERSGCNYLEDLITCVHIIQLKVLTCIRVGNKQKKIDLSIPKLDHFIHKVYVNVARKLYMNVYLYEKNLTALQRQKNMRELELLIQECILVTIRESVPTEDIIRAYMDESEEHEEEVFVEQVKEPVLAKANEVPKETRLENVPEEKVPVSIVPSIKNMDEEKVITRLSFNNNDSVLDEHNTIQHVDAPKTLERLEEISSSRALERMLAKNDDDDSDEERLQISTEDFDITNGIDVLDTKSNGLGQIYDNEINLDIEEL
jgi:hypothetical protein